MSGYLELKEGMNNDLHGLILPPQVLLGILLHQEDVTAGTGI